MVVAKPLRAAAARLHASEPMPGFIEPQRPRLAPAPPSGDEWVYEIKHDGYPGPGPHPTRRRPPFTRQSHDWTGRYGDLPAALGALRVREAIIDGEVVIQGEDGIVDWGRPHEAAAR